MTMITRTGKLFEAGSYPDKKFSLTEAEMDAAVAAFQPVSANIEHRPSLLDGKIGGLTRVWKQGKELFGAVQTPSWLHDLVGAEPIKPSLEWDRAGKKIQGIAYTINPRISDAALMSAFSAGGAEDADEMRALFGDRENPMQSIHDDACRFGAECGGKSVFSAEELAEFMTPETLKAIQGVHDHTAANGASCDLYATRKAVYYSAPADEFSTVVDLDSDHDETAPDTEAQRNPMEKPTLIQKLVSLFGKAGISEADVTATFAADDFNAHLSEADKALFAAQQTQIATLRGEARERAAKEFAAAEKRASRILPSEEAGVIAEFMQAAQDDDALPVKVSFSAGDKTVEGTRLDALKARYGARQPHDLLRELAQTDLPGAVNVVFNAAQTKQMDAQQAVTPEVTDNLLSRTPLGQAALAHKKAGK